MIPEEDWNKLIDLYNNTDLTEAQIAEIFCKSRETIKRMVSILRKQGRIPTKRISTNGKIILERYESGKMIKEIAEEIHVSPQRVSQYLKNHKVPKRILPKEEKPPKAPKEPKVPKEKTDSEFVKRPKATEFPKSTLPEGETVKCTWAVSHKCVYGVDKPTSTGNKCRYILITDKMRGCPHKACTRFSQISPTNKRLKSADYV